MGPRIITQRLRLSPIVGYLLAGVAIGPLNPAIRVFVRARYVAEREDLVQMGADGAVYEEEAAAVALSRLVLSDRGADADTVRRETTRVRRTFSA